MILGIVNVTPDSFSDGGEHATSAAAIEHGRRLLEQGADILDVGGESTRPGADPVAAAEELRRVLPVIEALSRDAVVSVDTYKAAVARAAVAAGARIINDVMGLRGDGMVEVVREAKAGVVVMHMHGTPRTMQDDPKYDDATAEVLKFLDARLNSLAEAGIPSERVVVDPGIGFGKTSEHNLELIARLGELGALGRPICLGVSRKGFLGRVLNGKPAPRRLAGSLAAVCHAVVHGTVQVVRVHDVEETRDALLVLEAIGGSARVS